MHRKVIHSAHLTMKRVWSIGWKKLTAIILGVLVVVMIIIQLCYPTQNLLPFRTVDNQSVGGMSKQQAITLLNTAYQEQEIAIYLGSSSDPVISPTLAEVDGSVDNSTRINALDYPWYIRLIPSSLFWWGRTVAPAPSPTFGDKFTHYIEQRIMPHCKEQPKDASLKADGGTMIVVPEIVGGTCKESDVIASIKNIQVHAADGVSVHVDREEQRPKVSTKQAQQRAQEINKQVSDGVSLKLPDSSMTIPAKDILSWLDVKADGDILKATINTDRASKWLAAHVAPTVSIKSGTSYVTTYNFSITSKKSGSSGRALSVESTIKSLQAVVDGTAKSATAVLVTIGPHIQYTRTYSADDTGLSALLANFAHDHKGTFGVSIYELGGAERHASFNGAKPFVTASTYKLFVAYTLLKEISEGKHDWASNEACFNKMISYSDNACAEHFLDMLGLRTITNEIQAIGLKDSTFMRSDNIYTTPNDLALLLGMIAKGQNFTSTNQQRLLSAMKKNVYRQGIPAGVDGTVADKVGFLWGLLHDAAIVYSSHGTYVMAIMTDGSSWGTIADLAKQVDNLLAQ